MGPHRSERRLPRALQEIAADLGHNNHNTVAATATGVAPAIAAAANITMTTPGLIAPHNLRAYLLFSFHYYYDSVAATADYTHWCLARGIKIVSVSGGGYLAV